MRLDCYNSLSINHEYGKYQDRVQEFVRRKGITDLFFDLDDTVLLTDPVFKHSMDIYAREIANISGIPLEDVSHEMRQIHSGLMAALSVQQATMAETARLTALRHNIEFSEHPEIPRHVAELMSIYEGKQFRPIPKAVEALGFFQGIRGLHNHAITLASQDVTEAKLHHARVTGRFLTKHYIDPTGRKDVTQWRRIVRDELGIDPKKILVFGDSWTSDIAPALEMGVPEDQVFRIKVPGELPSDYKVKGVLELSSIADVIPILAGRL